jgi:hypothetical protein
MIIIDRFEENIAILENDEQFTGVKRSLLPETAREGDIVELQPDGRYSVNEQATEERRRKVADRLKRMGL